jgi:hypothetical protein
MDLDQIVFKTLQNISGVHFLYDNSINAAIHYTLHKLDLKLESDDFEQVRSKVKENLNVVGFENGSGRNDSLYDVQS